MCILFSLKGTIN